MRRRSWICVVAAAVLYAGRFRNRSGTGRCLDDERGRRNLQLRANEGEGVQAGGEREGGGKGNELPIRGSSRSAGIQFVPGFSAEWRLRRKRVLSDAFVSRPFHRANRAFPGHPANGVP